MTRQASRNITAQEAGKRVDKLYSDGDFSPAELEAVRQWLADGEDELLKAEALSGKFDELYRPTPPAERELARRNWPALAARLGLDPALMERHVARMAEAEPETMPEPGSGRRTVPLRRLALRVAALLVPLLIVGGAIVLVADRSAGPMGRPEIAAVTRTITVTADTAREEVLPDGTTVRIKAGSELTYAVDFSENRWVKLNGEAFFTVTRDEAHPFRVESRGLTVTVLGTAFNVNAFDGKATAEVELVSGSVLVTTADRTVTMEPNQVVTFDRRTDLITLEEIGEADLLRLRGMSLSIDGRTLDEAFSMISQYFRVKIRVANQVDIRQEVVVNFEDDVTLEEALSIIRLAHGQFEYTIDADTVEITRSNR